LNKIIQKLMHQLLHFDHIFDCLMLKTIEKKRQNNSKTAINAQRVKSNLVIPGNVKNYRNKTSMDIKYTPKMK
jgi:hypothetical protein